MGKSKTWAVVTGASSGIGEAFARRLAAEGYNLLLIARRQGRLETLAEELTKRNGITAEALALDLTSEAGLQTAVDRVTAAEDLEFVVNNAGFGSMGRFFETEAESQDRMHRLHVMATLRLTHAALTGMVSRQKGNIVNVSSVAAFAQNPGNVSYCATKGWINIFTEGLYMELKSCGSPVRVQALCPGYTRSEFHDVLGVDMTSVPGGWYMSAEEVVDASLRGLARDKLFVVPGWRYRISVGLLGLMPRWLWRTLAIRVGNRFRKRKDTA